MSVSRLNRVVPREATNDPWRQGTSGLPVGRACFHEQSSPLKVRAGAFCREQRVVYRMNFGAALTCCVAERARRRGNISLLLREEPHATKMPLGMLRPSCRRPLRWRGPARSMMRWRSTPTALRGFLCPNGWKVHPSAGLATLAQLRAIPRRSALLCSPSDLLAAVSLACLSFVIPFDSCCCCCCSCCCCF